jgi:hypothetical protein
LQTTSGDGLLGLSKMAVPPLPIVILPDWFIPQSWWNRPLWLFFIC